MDRYVELYLVVKPKGFDKISVRTTLSKPNLSVDEVPKWASS